MRPISNDYSQNPQQDIPHSDLPDRFSDFFSEKIDRIRDDLDSRSREPPTFAIFAIFDLCHF